MERALDALEGVSVGDAFGQQFFRHEHEVVEMLKARKEPDGQWPWTDDTAMGLAIVAVLDRHAHMNQDSLAAAFGAAYRDDRSADTARECTACLIDTTRARNGSCSPPSCSQDKAHS